MELSKKKITYLIILIVLILLSFATLTYAYFTAAGITGNVTDANVVTLTGELGVIRVTYLDGNVINNTGIILNEDEGDYNSLLKFSIENEGTVAQDVVIHFEELTNGFCQYQRDGVCTNNSEDTDVRNELNYTLYECPTNTAYLAAEIGDISGCTAISDLNTTMPETGSRERIHNSGKITIEAETTTYYVFELTIENTDEPQDYNQNKLISGEIMVDYIILPTFAEAIETKYTPVSDATSSTYVTSATGINFGAISSDTNGKGLYINDKVNIVDDPTQGMIKYFRGDVDNYVELADILWRVIRIDETNQVRLITQDTVISSRAFNPSRTDPKYVGYTYDDSSVSTNDGTPAPIKTAIDTWYASNLSSYTSYINQTAAYCNDASGSTSAFGAYTRIYTNKTPTYNCPTPISTYGGTYQLPVGMITADEVAYAGGLYSTANSTYYLNNNTFFWTMSPFFFSDYARELYVYSTAHLSNDTVHNTAGPGGRPVITLNANTLVTGQGTIDDPWVVE